jgi:hypothetical protein
MKYSLLILLILILGSALTFNSCDSVTDSKPESVSRPVLIAPADNAVNVPTAAQFKWDGTATVIEIDINSSFNSAQKLSYSVSASPYNIPVPLSTNTFYYWRAGNTVGGTTYWSENNYTFTTGSN